MATLGEKLKKATAPNTRTALPSGLASEEAATFAGNLATALRQAKRTALELSVDNITLNDDGSLTLPPGDLPTTAAEEQTAFATLLYTIATGEKFAGSFANLPEATATVLEKGHNGGYNSVGELAGAFGWSLYRLNLPQTVAKRQKYNSKRLQNIAPLVVPPVLRYALPAAAVLGIAALVIFVLFSAITIPAKTVDTVEGKDNPNTSAPPGATLTPSVPPYFVTTRSPDGAQLTRFNPATNLSAPQLSYTPPPNLPAGGVTSLNGKRPLVLQNAQWSPSRTLLYLSTTDGGWEVWDTQSRSRISRREIPDADNYLWMSYAPNGENFVALGFDGQLRLGINGRVRKTVPFIVTGNETAIWQFEDWANYFHWSPNSNKLAIQRFDQRYNIWDFEGEVRQIQPPNNTNIPELITQSSAFNWAKNSRSFAIYSAPTNQIVLYDALTLQRLYSIDLDGLRVDGGIPLFDETASSTDFDLSADGRYLAIFRRLRSTGSSEAGDNALAIFELPNGIFKPGEIVKTANAQAIRIAKTERYGTTVSVEWARNNNLALLMSGSATASPSENINVSNRLIIYALQNAKWEAVTGLPLEKLSPSPILYRQFWSPDGRQILLSKSDGYLALYPLIDDKLGEPNVLQESNNETMLGWSFSPDGKWLAYYDRWHTLVVQDALTRRTVFTETVQSSAKPHVNGGQGFIKWSPDSRFFRVLYSAASDTFSEYEARIWQVKENKFSNYGAVVLPDMLDTPPDWNYNSVVPQLLFRFGTNDIVAYDLSTPPDSVDLQRTRWLASGIFTKTREIDVSNLANRKPDYSKVGLPIRVVGQTYFSNNFDGAEVVAWSRAYERAVYTRGAERILRVSNPIVKNAPSVNLEYSPADVQLSPVPDLNMLHDYNLDFSADGKQLAIGLPNGLVNVYDINTGQLTGAWTAHQAMITSAKFSPDGKLLATASADRTIKVWDVATGRNIQMLRAHLFPIYNLVWLDNGRSLATQSGNYGAIQILIWRIR